jgi:hypothetical protein
LASDETNDLPTFEDMALACAEYVRIVTGGSIYRGLDITATLEDGRRVEIKVYGAPVENTESFDVV